MLLNMYIHHLFVCMYIYTSITLRLVCLFVVHVVLSYACMPSVFKYFVDVAMLLLIGMPRTFTQISWIFLFCVCLFVCLYVSVERCWTNLWRSLKMSWCCGFFLHLRFLRFFIVAATFAFAIVAIGVVALIGDIDDVDCAVVVAADDDSDGDAGVAFFLKSVHWYWLLYLIFVVVVVIAEHQCKSAAADIFVAFVQVGFV